jgi:hypothetical protein
MASISETGYAKNTANFDQLVSSAVGYGATFNPAKATLKVAALQTLSKSAKSAVSAVNAAEAAEKNAQKARLVAFNALKPLATRVLNALIASGSTPEIDESAKAIVRAIRGTRVSAKATEDEKKAAAAEGKTIKEISSSRQSYDIMLDNFDKLIKLLSGIVEYAPNETELKVATLTTLYSDLKAKNAAVVTAITATSNARIARSGIMDKEITGLTDVALDVKAYIKSVYGASSLQYKQVAKLKFRKLS